jgi:hypothetical protein
MSGPLTRRRKLLADSLDEDLGPDMTPDELARFVDAAKRQAARRDRAQVETGQQLLAGYLEPGRTYPGALRAYVSHLLTPSSSPGSAVTPSASARPSGTSRIER